MGRGLSDSWHRVGVDDTLVEVITDPNDRRGFDAKPARVR